MRSSLHQRLQRILEPTVILAAVATVPLAVVESRYRSPALDALDWLIWALFAAELVALLATAPDRRRFLASNVLLLVVVALSFPLLPAVASLSRLARLVPALRFVVLVVRAVPALRRTVGRTHHGIYGACLTVLVVTAGGAAFTIVEPTVRGDFWSGLWWAVVTVTTVGYGDISPATVSGRVVAVFLMLTGIGLTATVAATIAAHLVDQDSDEDHGRLLDRLDRIERLLEAQAERRG